MPVALGADKPATAIVRDTAKQIGDGPVRMAGKFDAGGIKVSNAERVIDPSNGRTKLDLVRYYESSAECRATIMGSR